MSALPGQSQSAFQYQCTAHLMIHAALGRKNAYGMSDLFYRRAEGHERASLCTVCKGLYIMHMFMFHVVAGVHGGFVSV